MNIDFKILPTGLLDSYLSNIDFDIKSVLKEINLQDTVVDSFNYYNSISSVYSSKIEGEEIEFDSFFKHKFMGVSFKADYTKKADDLLRAYEYAFKNDLNLSNILEVHKIISANLLPTSERGRIRTNPMFVINNADKIEYVAAAPHLVKNHIEQLFYDIDILLKQELTIGESLFFGSLIHLVFVKIHPLQDGNGRTARLLEKWFLQQKIGNQAVAINLEKNYYTNIDNYYNNIKKLGIEYSFLDYTKSLPFLNMTLEGLKTQLKN